MTMGVDCILHFLVIIGSSSILISAGDVNHVKPIGIECSNGPCLTLNDYARQSEEYFVSNSTFIFLPGTHEMEINLKLENLTDIVLYGSSNSSTIVFSPLANITWIDSENISIAHLVFILTGSTDSETFFSTLYFLDCSNVYLSATSFVGGDGSTYSTALRCHTSNMTVTNCTFSNCSSFYGAGVTTYSCSITISDNNFIDNNAQAFGGGAGFFSSHVMIANGNIFVNNGATYSGGAIYFMNCEVMIVGQNTFFNNSVIFDGGALSFDYSIVEMKGTNLFVSNKATYHGGAVSSFYSLRLHIMEITQFFNNFAGWLGGAMMVFNSTAKVSGNVSFDSNTASKSGGGIAVTHNSSLVAIKIYLKKNAANIRGGGIMITHNSSLVAIEIHLKNTAAISGGGISCSDASQLQLYGVRIEENEALIGGAVHMFLWCSASLKNTSIITKNRAIVYGGAIYVSLHSLLVLSGENYITNNAVALGGGGIHVANSNAFLIGTTYLFNNSAEFGGGALSIVLADIVANGSTFLLNNSARQGGGMICISASIAFQPSAESIFSANRADQYGGAIYGLDKSLTMTGTHNFSENSGNQGGAVMLQGDSKFRLVSPLNANFADNRAEHTGGAIFIDDPISITQCNKSLIQQLFDFGFCQDPTSVLNIKECSRNKECFFELESQVPFNSSLSNITITFVNNSAGIAGTVLYGGLLDECRVYLGGGIEDDCGNRAGGEYSDDPIAIFKSFSTIDNETSSISSDPFHVCFCKDGIPDCHLNLSIETVTGKEFVVSAVTVGQGNFTVPSSIRVDLDKTVQLNPVQNIQSTGLTCTDVRYRLYSAEDFITLVLYPDGPCRDIGIARREIDVAFLPCPEGFMKSGSECVCEERLRTFTTNCNVDDSSVERSQNNFWAEAFYKNQTYEGLIIHPSGCPSDYCVDTPVRLTLDNPDVQCDHNHSGTLCGSCKENFSIALGSLHCLPCSNAYLALILPFALAGIALVAFLLLLHLTVAQGTLSGLILYANTVQVNRHIFFPPGETNILTTFIAWLNLDLGIETCFCDGINVYVYTWLQYLFPFYVWFLIGFVIVLCSYSTSVSRSLGRNPVAVLSTLILLSYAKILQTIITSLSYTSLEYPNHTLHHVWLFNGDVPYFQSGEHIALGVFAILTLVFLFLPYTVLMLISHKLIAYSDKWVLSWLNKIMPFLDTYHAPYRREHRYWTGFLLLIRCALFLTFALNSLGSASVNLITITSVTTGLMVVAWIRGKLYLKLYNDILEASFVLNLCIFSAATYHVNETGGSQAGLAYTSVGIAFAIFIGILIFHVYLKLKDTTVWKKLMTKIVMIYNHYRQVKENKKASTVAREQETPIRDQRLPTTSVIELDLVDQYTA